MIEFLSEDAALVHDEEGRSAFTFEVIDKRRRDSTPAYNPLDAFTNRGYVSRFGEWNIFPYGENNAVPLSIRNVVYSNSIVPGILTKKTGLNWGRGAHLYEETYDGDGALVRKYQDSKAIWKWLDSFAADRLILKATVDFSHIESWYCRFTYKKGWRIGDRPEIARLDHIQPSKPLVLGKKQTPTHIAIEDLDDHSYSLYPLQEPGQELVKAAQTVMYSNLPGFCSDFFTIPQILGAIPWIQQSTNVPLFLAALSRNSINIKYHITSPQTYWENKRDELQSQCNEKGIPYNERMLKVFRKRMLASIQKVLSSIDNAGKFWHSENVLNVEGNNIIELGWKITPIDQKMNDIVDAHIKIAGKADQAASAAVAVGSTLGNTGETGRANGGSEQYYAMNNYLQSSIDIPEMVILEPLNFALRQNFPDSNLKLGFYHTEPKRQEDLTASKRNKISDFNNGTSK